MDYTSAPINVTFLAGATNAKVAIPVTVDNIVEETESFTITIIIPSSLKDQVTPGNITEVIGIITDDSGKVILEATKPITFNHVIRHNCKF